MPNVLWQLHIPGHVKAWVRSYGLYQDGVRAHHCRHDRPGVPVIRAATPP
jgi:hypothetical protein